MVRIFSIALLLFASVSSFGQKTKNTKRPTTRTATEANPGTDLQQYTCIRKGNITAAEIAALYPFNTAAKVEIISFEGYTINVNGRQVPHIPVSHDTVFYSRIKETQTLSSNYINKLGDIIHNYGFPGKVIDIGSKCYEPRNGILFFDADGKLLDYIEICFECDRIGTSSNRISLGELCDQKLHMVRDIFIINGIKFGITQR
jgi:hypothetical protein